MILVKSEKIVLNEKLAGRKTRIKLRYEVDEVVTWVKVVLQLKFAGRWRTLDKRRAFVTSDHSALEQADILLNHMIEDYKYLNTGLDLIRDNQYC